MDKILEMKRDLTEKAKKFREFIEPILTAKRALTEEETATRDTMKREIGNLKAAIEMSEEARGILDSIPAAPPAAAGRNQVPDVPNVITKRAEDLEPGIRLARYVKATLVSQKEGRAFEEVALRMYPRDKVLQESRSAMGTTAPSDGGVFVPEDLSTEIIPLLREKSTVRTLGARTIPMPNGNLKIPRQTGAANFQWVGENKPIISSKTPLGMLNLAAKKLAGMIPASNELINSSAISADAFIRDELVNGIAEAEDITAIYGAGTNDTPAGILKLAGTSSDLGDVPTSDALGDVVGVVMGKKFPNKTNFGWIFSGVLWSNFYNLKDGVGNYIHRAEMDRGLLLGYKFGVNNNIVVNTDTHGTTEIYFGDFSQFIIGETLGLQIAVSQEASYMDGSNLVSAFANDQTVMRALVREDFGVRYADAFVVKTKVWTKA